jgi:DNA-binding CsgD family transcriptional regulator
MTDRISTASAVKARSRSVALARIPRPNAQALNKLGLSQRESEVLVWVAQGKTNGEIAAALGINLGTVKKHLAHIFRKLGVGTRTGAAALALTMRSPSEG